VTSRRKPDACRTLAGGDGSAHVGCNDPHRTPRSRRTVRRSRSRARSNASPSARERRTPGSTWSALTTSEPSLRSDFRSARRRSDRAPKAGCRTARGGQRGWAAGDRARSPPQRRSAHDRPLRRAARASRRGRPSTGSTANGGAHLLTLPEDAALQGRPNTICASPTGARQGFRLPDCPAGRANRSLRRRTGRSRSSRFPSGSRQEFLAARRSAMARACRPR
jgi:hypothetical protein